MYTHTDNKYHYHYHHSDDASSKKFPHIQLSCMKTALCEIVSSKDSNENDI